VCTAGAMPAATPRLVSAGSYWQRGFCTRRSTEAVEATGGMEMVEQTGKEKEKEEVAMVVVGKEFCSM